MKAKRLYRARLTSVTMLDGSGGHVINTVNQTDTEYDSCGCSPLGKLKRTSLPHAPASGAIWTTNTYDGIGRTVSVLAPDGQSTTTYAYQGNVVTVTDPAGKWKKYTSDAFGRLVTVEEPNPAGGSYFTTYTYDLLDHLIGVSMPRPTGRSCKAPPTRRTAPSHTPTILKSAFPQLSTPRTKRRCSPMTATIA